MTNKNLMAKALQNIVKRMNEATVSPEDALDELLELDPETALGQTMNAIMSHIASLQLLDFYIGYEREDNVIKMYLSSKAKPENLKELILRIETEIEKPSEEATEKTPLVSAKIYKTNTSKDDFDWVIELMVYQDKPDEISSVPVKTDLAGDVKVSDETLTKEPENKEQMIP